VPAPTTFNLRLRNDGSVADTLTSEDGQLTLDLPAGAVLAGAEDFLVGLSISPLDPGRLGMLPDGARPDGNAYHIDVVLVPAGLRPTTLAPAAKVVVRVPQTAEKVFVSTDGRAWTELPLTRPDSFHVSFLLATTGYVVASAGVPRTHGIAPDRHLVRRLAVALATLVAAGVLLLPFGLRHRRRRGI
jgi:hypothetical protein